MPGMDSRLRGNDGGGGFRCYTCVDIPNQEAVFMQGHYRGCGCVGCAKERADSIPNENPGLSELGPTYAGTHPTQRQNAAQDYLEVLARRLKLPRIPLLIFKDGLANPGACGEAGQNTVWLLKSHVESRQWPVVKDTIEHELAHIWIANKWEWRHVPTHGVAFERTLTWVKSMATELSQGPSRIGRRRPILLDIGLVVGALSVIAIATLVAANYLFN